MLKTASSVLNAIGALNYAGTWDANANNPTLTSSVGTKGNYYIVSVAGTTTLNGISLWSVGDWAVFNGSVWEKVNGSSNEAFSNITVTSLTGYMYANNTSPVTASLTIPNSGLTNNSVTYNGTTVALGGSGTITAANPNALTIGTGLSGTSYTGASPVTIAISSTTVTAASYGNASTVATFTVNAQGQLTAAGNSTISIAPSQINATIPNSGLTNSTATLGNATITLGGTTSTVGNLTLANATITSGSLQNISSLTITNGPTFSILQTGSFSGSSTSPTTVTTSSTLWSVGSGAAGKLQLYYSENGGGGGGVAEWNFAGEGTVVNNTTPSITKAIRSGYYGVTITSPQTNGNGTVSFSYNFDNGSPTITVNWAIFYQTMSI